MYADLIVDTLTAKQRSERMALVRSKNTKPEMVVRKLVHSMGYRYRLHVPTLPGKPDMVFPSKKAVIFVHGCFWHRHSGCKLARLPKSRLDFWFPKLNANQERDTRQARVLRRLGWRVMTVWECQVVKSEILQRRITRFLGQ